MDIYVFPWLRKQFNRIKFYFVDFTNQKVIESTHRILSKHKLSISEINNHPTNYSYEEMREIMINCQEKTRQTIKLETDRQLKIIEFRRILLYRLIQSFFNILRYIPRNSSAEKRFLFNEDEESINLNLQNILYHIIKKDQYLLSEYNTTFTNPDELFLRLGNYRDEIFYHTVDEIISFNEEICSENIFLIRGIFSLSDFCTENSRLIDNFAKCATLHQDEIEHMKNIISRLKNDLEKVNIKYEQVCIENKELINNNTDLLKRINDLRCIVKEDQIPIPGIANSLNPKSYDRKYSLLNFNRLFNKVI